MEDSAEFQQLRDRVTEILRRDLKLGPDIKLEPEAPLFDSAADLDSLDMLLLVSSIEREFGFKIPSESVGEAIFRSIDTLTKYIQETSRSSAANPPAFPAAGPADPLDRLPHAEPFRFVTRLTQLNPEDTAEGIWVVSGKEAFFAGHFPGHPIVPGVLIAEALAQLSGLIAPPASATAGKLAHLDVRFDRPVTPPAEIVLHSKLVRKVVSLQQFEVSATVNGQVAARGSLAIQHG
jgi:3-hydroxyacyl-[acyl-carrier-protein] dehydratase